MHLHPCPIQQIIKSDQSNLRMTNDVHPKWLQYSYYVCVFFAYLITNTRANDVTEVCFGTGAYLSRV